MADRKLGEPQEDLPPISWALHSSPPTRMGGVVHCPTDSTLTAYPSARSDEASYVTSNDHVRFCEQHDSLPSWGGHPPARRSRECFLRPSPASALPNSKETANTPVAGRVPHGYSCVRELRIAAKSKEVGAWAEKGKRRKFRRDTGSGRLRGLLKPREFPLARAVNTVCSSLLRFAGRYVSL